MLMVRFVPPVIVRVSRVALLDVRSSEVSAVSKDAPPSPPDHLAVRDLVQCLFRIN